MCLYPESFKDLFKDGDTEGTEGIILAFMGSLLNFSY